MRRWMKSIWLVIMFACVVGIINPTQAGAKSKTKKVTLDLNGDYATVKRPSGLNKARKVVVKSSKKSVAKAKYSKKKGDRRVDITGKRVGKATITVKCYYKKKKAKTYKYKVSVVRKHKQTVLEKSKEAFKIQNQYRKDNGVKALEWSDEIYQFCMYRLKTSGFDSHKNLGRDMNNYFGNFAKFKSLMFSENMTTATSAQVAMKHFKNSAGHYRNLLGSDHVCGAVATYNGMWFAIYYNQEKSVFDNWKSYQLKAVTVQRYDTVTGSAISGSTIGYYESNQRENTLKIANITKPEGETIYLEIGKTYVIYERICPDGYEKAENVTITITADGTSEVKLYSSKITTQ